MPKRKLTTREYLEQQREVDREYHGHLWWVRLTKPTLLRQLACAKGDELCAVLAAVYYLWFYEKYDKKDRQDGDTDAPTE